jgi:hypothetical protein
MRESLKERPKSSIVLRLDVVVIASAVLVCWVVFGGDWSAQTVLLAATAFGSFSLYVLRVPPQMGCLASEERFKSTVVLRVAVMVIASAVLVFWLMFGGNAQRVTLAAIALVWFSLYVLRETQQMGRGAGLVNERASIMPQHVDQKPKQTMSIRWAMVVIAGAALVFWLLFARDEETVMLAIFAYLAFSLIVVVLMPIFLFHRRCPECRKRAMHCMSIILIRPPLHSYYCCELCNAQFERLPFRRWIRLDDPLPAKMWPQRRGSTVVDPLIWVSTPSEPPTARSFNLFSEDAEP